MCAAPYVTRNKIEQLSMGFACEQFPLGKKLSGVWEPTVAATVVTPSEHVGSIMELFQDRRGEMTEHTVLSPARTLLRCASCGAMCVAFQQTFLSAWSLLLFARMTNAVPAFCTIIHVSDVRRNPVHFAIFSALTKKLTAP